MRSALALIQPARRRLLESCLLGACALGAGIGLLAVLIAIATIRIRRQDLSGAAAAPQEPAVPRLLRRRRGPTGRRRSESTRPPGRSRILREAGSGSTPAAISGLTTSRTSRSKTRAGVERTSRAAGSIG